MSPDPMLLGKRVSWAELCQAALQAPIKSVQHKPIARLWSGYGSIQEVTAVTQDGQQHDLIVKQVDPPQGRGVSHERKLKSYAAEAAFYSNYSSRVQSAGGSAIAEALLVDVGPPSHFLFVLSDLRAQYPLQKWSLDLQVPGQDPSIGHDAAFSISTGSTANSSSGPLPPRSLWDQGCYWHLDTRQQEFDSIPRSQADLREAARRVDAVLKGQRADGSLTNRHQTLVHGDFKSENLLWDASGKCCAYDFQYVGKGLGVRDVAYMLASSVDISVLEREGGEQRLLQHYHDSLQQQLRRVGKPEAAKQYSYDVMTAHFELCLVDYVRFMAGWGMWGNAEWAADRAGAVLKHLNVVIAMARTGW